MVAALLGAGTARIGAEPGASPRFEWAFDGAVGATARSGNTVYVGGAFHNVLPLSGVLGQVYAVSPATGAVVPSIIPRLSLGTSALGALPDGAGGFFLRGNLPIGSGNGANRVVHLRADGTVDPVFRSPPELSGYGAMVRVGPSLILAGFNSVSGVIRPLVALDAATGALSPWHPDVKDDDYGRAALAANGILYVASGFFYGGTRRVMAFNGTTGATLWEDDLGPGPGLNGGGLVLAGGRLIAVAGGLRAYDPATGVRDLA
ncbi:MAG TPA: PQQ-binding-like beta-propeller repeat protein [Vicinamibacterales bacterium]|nr:PQQ-binding-like beta-propeller repeat protein [Vicinamibacterales bacterium]